MYSFRSLLCAFCLALFSSIAYGQSVANYWGTSGVSTTGQCKKAIKSELETVRNTYCAGLTSADYKECIKYSYNPVKKQLTYACKTFGKQWNKYVSRQSPVNLLGSINIDYSVTAASINGRTALDVQASQLIDVEAL